jgi:hypothetical protein
MCDYVTLLRLLHRFSQEAEQRPLTLGEVTDRLDETAYAFIAIILILPLLQPMPLGPLTVLGGLTLAILGRQLLQGHHAPVLPARVRGVVLGKRMWQMIIAVSLRLVGFCRRFTRPRMQHLVNGQRGRRVAGHILIAGGLLMAIPFPVPLPLNNFLPGVAVIFYCIGELEDDGVMVFVAVFLLCVTVVYFVAFYVLIWLFGRQALSYLLW